jgi:hypothetical protein
MNFYLETDSSCGPKGMGIAVIATQAGKDSTAMIPRRKFPSTYDQAFSLFMYQKAAVCV